MGWTRPSGVFIRAFVAVLLFADQKNLRREGRNLGAFLLQLGAPRHHGQPLFYARHAVARALHHRIVFLSTVGRRIRPGLACKIDIVLRERVLHLVVDPD